MATPFEMKHESAQLAAPTSGVGFQPSGRSGHNVDRKLSQPQHFPVILHEMSKAILL
jgi:hypothetical protein